jgi:hypothetical protein
LFAPHPDTATLPEVELRVSFDDHPLSFDDSMLLAQNAS